MTTPLAMIRAVAYTPQHQVYSGWLRGDSGRIREQMSQIAELGMSHVLLQPSWFRLQPQATRISSACMHLIEQCLDMAHQHRLKSIVSLLAVTDGGALTLPSWHNHADVVGWLQGYTTQPISMHGIPAIIDGQWRTLRAANPFCTVDLVAAQQLLVRTVMGYFATHPACDYWMLAPGWSRMQSTATAAQATQWWQQLCAVAFHVAPHARLMGVIDAPTLRGHHALTLSTLVSQCHTLVVDTAMPELSKRRQRRLSTPAVFAHDLAHALSNKPVVVACAPVFHATTRTHWQQIPWHQQHLDIPCLMGDDPGMYVTQLLQRLHQCGAAGIIWPQATPSTPSHDDLPISWLPHQLELCDAHGHVTSAGGAWATGSRQQSAPHTNTPSIDAERFWHHPTREFARLWQAYE